MAAHSLEEAADVVRGLLAERDSLIQWGPEGCDVLPAPMESMPLGWDEQRLPYEDLPIGDESSLTIADWVRRGAAPKFVAALDKILNVQNLLKKSSGSAS